MLIGVMDQMFKRYLERRLRLRVHILTFIVPAAHRVMHLCHTQSDLVGSQQDTQQKKPKIQI